jgi:hypothetical protein
VTLLYQSQLEEAKRELRQAGLNLCRLRDVARQTCFDEDIQIAIIPSQDIGEIL